MSITRTFPVWRNPIVELWVPAGTRNETPFVPRGPEWQLDADWHETPLSFDAFTTGASDYDTPSDEIYCPCGAMVSRTWDGNVGEALREIYAHCKKAKHPKPRIEL